MRPNPHCLTFLLVLHLFNRGSQSLVPTAPFTQLTTLLNTVLQPRPPPQLSKSILTSCYASTKSYLSLNHDDKDRAPCVSGPTCSHFSIWKGRSQHRLSSCRYSWACKTARTRNGTCNGSKVIKTCSWLMWWFLASVPAHFIPILTAV